MPTYFDTSAIVPLLLVEPHSSVAREAWEASTGDCFAWRWLKVETEAALVRRKADAGVWSAWDRLESSLNWITLPDSEIEAVCRFNRNFGLRAADAGHLFIADRLSRSLHSLYLASLDKEMCEAAQELQLPLALG